MNLLKKNIIIEQIALMFASLTWTLVAMTIIVLFWLYQDVQARWDVILQPPVENQVALVNIAQAASLPTSTATVPPTAVLWSGPPPSSTPTPTIPPTPIPTRVIQPPSLLPETYNPDEPTPISVIVADIASEFTVPIVVPVEIATTATAVPNVPIAETEIVLNNDLPSRLVIESVGIDSPIVTVNWRVVEQNGQQYSIWDVADNAVGWHKTTAPLGKRGNTVMAGHHNVAGEVFRYLVNVEVGDKVVVYSKGNKFEYKVELKTIVKEKGEPVEVRQRNARWISATDDERLTFVTCWPYTNNTHRVIVVAKPI